MVSPTTRTRKRKEVQVNSARLVDAGNYSQEKRDSAETANAWTLREIQHALGEPGLVRETSNTLAPWRVIDTQRLNTFQAGRKRPLSERPTEADIEELTGGAIQPAPGLTLPELKRSIITADSTHLGSVRDMQLEKLLSCGLSGDVVTYLKGCAGESMRGSGHPTFDRPLDYYSSANGGMFGIKAWTLENEGAVLLMRFAANYPEETRRAFGEHGARLLQDRRALQNATRPPWWKNQPGLQACARFSWRRHAWLVIGWWEVSRSPAMVTEQIVLALEAGFGLSETEARAKARSIRHCEPIRAMNYESYRSIPPIPGYK